MTRTRGGWRAQLGPARADAFEPWQGPHDRIDASAPVAAVAASILHRLESAEPRTP
ncbi:hypothetical protein [Microbacterium invictum]|uniref:Uncharacterized protein n=1 Tax=Microbacterium invictum TaxID=515415 RepID=A0ABZ0V7Q3_9MICO|nr:hypothetical protein [Microbacterium invictum]WQB69658.1 hypothetical protein T9R20_13270 [Microbacterium invictum]